MGVLNMKRLFILSIMRFLLLTMYTFAIKTSKVPSGMQINKVEESIDKIMETYVGENREIPGAAIVIVKDGNVILEKGYGMSDVENEIKVNPEKTVFEAASISKVYTWSAVMQLVEQGKIDLHEDIREYLPDDYLELEFPDKITMLDLMNHTAGFEDTTEQLLTTNAENVIPLKNYLSKEHEQPTQIFRPGTVTAYSNYGASLAGYIIERVTNESFAEYMQTYVLDKLEMEHSSFQSDYSDQPKIANYKSKSYEKKNGNFEAVDWAYVNDAPAGSLNTTVQDMAYFMLAHLDSNEYQLFKQKTTLDEMHQQTSSFTKNAHGFWERPINDYRVLEHGGNSVGYTTQMTLLPEESFGMVLLTNVGEEMSRLRIDLTNTLIGEQEKPENLTSHPNDDKVSGTYRMARGNYTNFLKLLPIISDADVTIKQNKSGGITLQTAADPEPLQYVETDNLTYERVDDTIPLIDQAGMDTSQVHFKMDKQGNVIKMTYGTISDFLPVHLKDRVDVNLIIIMGSILTFLVYALVSLIQWLIRMRKKSPLNTFPTTGVLAGIGLFVTVNIIILYSRFIQNPFQELAPLNIHMWINYLLPIAFIFCSYFSIKQWKQKTRAQNSARIFLLIVSFIFSMTLFHFNLL